MTTNGVNGHTNGVTKSKKANFFASAPPFPDDVPQAPLLQISLEKLKAHDTTEIGRFTKACEDLGFFYLDLHGSKLGEAIQGHADDLFDLSEEFFDLPVEEKVKFDNTNLGTTFGYKGYGAEAINAKGDLDRNEFYNISKDDMIGIGKNWPIPDVIETRRSLLKSFITEAHEIVNIVLTLLNDHLKLPPGTLQQMHQMENNSGDQVRFIKAPPQPPDDSRTSLKEHTDFGSVTVLFNRLGGLQILPPGKDQEWCYVKPHPGNCIVNLGDAMVKFTNGVLRSNIHRVNAPPGEQGSHTRYSLVYFNRPADGVVLKRLEGSDKIPPLPEGMEEDQVKSEDWVMRRMMGGRVAYSKFDFDTSSGTEKISKRDQ